VSLSGPPPPGENEADGQPTADIADLSTATAGPSGAPRPGAYSGPKTVGGYRIVRELGAGGMGTVFEALDEKMQRHVALKVLGRHLSEHEGSSDRFTREAWIAGRLNHPNLVRVLARGEDQDVRFYSMELVDGGSLHEVVRNLKTFGKDERWGLVTGSREYVVWAIQQVLEAARGLEYAHRQGVIHRDVKPMNILLNRDPFGVKVGDFGLAVDLGAARMTTAGKVMGTFAYMAPEQICGQHDRVGPWTDVYALGVTLFELLTLELPYSGSTHQMYMNAVLTSEARRPHKLNERVGRDLETVLQKALEKDPASRYASMAKFADDLENVLQFRPIEARPVGAASRVVKWARRKPIHAALAGVLVIGLPVTGILAARAVEHRRLVRDLEVTRWKDEAQRLVHDDRFRQALAPLDRILGVRPGDRDALVERSLSLARLAMVERDPARMEDLRSRALADIGGVIAREPGARWPYRIRAFLLKTFGNDAKAAEDEAKAATLARAPREFYEVQIEGILAMIGGDNPTALDRFGELIRMRPDAADARLWRASVQERLGDPARAMIDDEVAAALKPSDIVSRLNLARLKTETGALQDGAALYEQVLDLELANARAHEGYAANLLEQGRAKVAVGDAAAADLFRRAVAESRQALERDPDLPWAHVNLGAGLVEENRLLKAPDDGLIREASAEFARAIALKEKEGSDARDKVYQAALTDQCDALIQTRVLDRASAACGRVAELWPDLAAAQYNLAGVHALSGRRDEALSALRRDLELGDHDADYLAGDPWFESLRSDPGFRAIVAKMRGRPPRS
jgi:tetratricopeptide (TPR) repeat protein